MGKTINAKAASLKASSSKSAKAKKSLRSPKEYKFKKINAKAKGTIRVMSWNIQGTYADNAKIANVSSKRQAKARILGSIITKAQPDIVTLQEVAGGSTKIFESELKKQLPEEYQYAYHHDQPGNKGQRYMVLYKKGIKVDFKGFSSYDTRSLKKGSNTLETEVATIGRRPLSMLVTTDSSEFKFTTWHAPHGNELSADYANRVFSSHLSSASTNEEHIMAGDFNITRENVKRVYNIDPRSLASNSRFDHIASIEGGTTISGVKGLPTAKSLKNHYGFPVSDHSMVMGDVQIRSTPQTPLSPLSGNKRKRTINQ